MFCSVVTRYKRGWIAMSKPVQRKLSKDVRRVLPREDANGTEEGVRLPRGSKTICIPCGEQEYAEIIEDGCGSFSFTLNQRKNK